MKKRADGRYQKKMTINGKTVTFYGTSIKEINQKVLAYEEKKEHGRTYREVSEEWWLQHSITLAMNSLSGLRPAVKRAEDYFGDFYIKEITSKQVRSFIEKFASLGYAKKTTITQLQAIRQVLHYAINNDELQYNVATNVDIPKNLKKKDRELPSSEAIEAVKNAPSDGFNLFAKIAFYTGMRKGEILALQYGDIDYNKMVIHVTKSVYHVNNKPLIKTPKTKAGERDIILLEQLAEIIPKGDKDQFIFEYKGDAYTHKHYTTSWNNYCKSLGYEFTAHQLRHAYTTRLYELDIDVKTAQTLLGHADISTTLGIYTHLSEQKKNDATNKLLNF